MKVIECNHMYRHCIMSWTPNMCSIWNVGATFVLMHFHEAFWIYCSFQDELEAELEELESAELEEQLLQPTFTAPAPTAQVPAGRQTARPVPAKPTPEEDELAALQAEMALWAGNFSGPWHNRQICVIYICISFFHLNWCCICM